MNRLQHYLACLITTVFLLQTLTVQAQKTPPPQLPARVSCDSLLGKSAGVQQRLKQYANLVRGRQCIVLSAEPKKDLAHLINQIPENTVILLSSNTVPDVTPSSSFYPVTGTVPVKYFINSEIVLKDGQDIIGAADDGFEIIITPVSKYTNKYMVRVGATANFQFGETRDSHISHITFLPTYPEYFPPIGAIVFAECYNRRLILENNLFHLPDWSAVDLDCKQPLDASVNDRRPGPGLLFTNNTVIGNKINTWYLDYIPEEGLFIHLPAIKNQSMRIAVNGNTFRGRMADAGEFILGPGTSMDVFRNTIDINNAGTTHRAARSQRQQRECGFALVSHIKNTGSERPLFNLAGNQIRVTGTALAVSPPLELAMACNHLQAVTPWRQLLKQFSLKAVDPLLIADECLRPLSPPVARPAHTSYTSRDANTWTAIYNSTATACTGLVNFEGQFLFDSEVCQLFSALSAPGIRIAVAHHSSAAVTSMRAALGVMTTLTLLLNLYLK